MIGVTLEPRGIVMELYPYSLEILIIKNDGVRDFSKLLKILINASAGVIHLHAQGIIHRDIAARNFLVKVFSLQISEIMVYLGGSKHRDL